MRDQTLLNKNSDHLLAEDCFVFLNSVQWSSTTWKVGIKSVVLDNRFGRHGNI